MRRFQLVKGTMLRYETLILTVPEITADESSTLESEFESNVKKAKGSTRSYERWGKYRLSYPVWRNDYGVYFLVRFEVEEGNVDALTASLNSMFKVKFPQLVMRFMISKLDINQSLEYQKPESLEDVPSQDVDTFLRENKMEGLIKKPKPVVADKPEVKADEKSESGDAVESEESEEAETPVANEQ